MCDVVLIFCPKRLPASDTSRFWRKVPQSRDNAGISSFLPKKIYQRNARVFLGLGPSAIYSSWNIPLLDEVASMCFQGMLVSSIMIVPEANRRGSYPRRELIC